MKIFVGLFVVGCLLQERWESQHCSEQGIGIWQADDK